jgi:dihydroorotate dehydrogenase electron transfer subunit
MMEKFVGTVVKNKEIAEDIYSMWVYAPDIAESAAPGQFVSLYSSDPAHLLPRPISICDVNAEKKRVRFVYRVVGSGTREFSLLEPGEGIPVLGPLGHGYNLKDFKKGDTALLFGGGVGIPPLLFLAKVLKHKGVKVITALGYRSSDTFLTEKFKKYGDVIISTDDGSLGFHGNVIDAVKDKSVLKKEKISGICACGPTPMLKGVKSFGIDNNIKTQLSLEEHMACGVGVCLGCIVKTPEIDAHSNNKNKRVCKDGPVFYAGDVIL